MYTVITEDNHESKKAKSINKNAVNDELKFEDSKSVFFNRSYMRHEISRNEKSKEHSIGSYKTNEISLSS